MLAADRFLQGSRDEQLNSSSQSPQSTENLSHRLAAKSPAGLQALSAVLTPPPRALSAVLSGGGWKALSAVLSGARALSAVLSDRGERGGGARFVVG